MATMVAAGALVVPVGATTTPTVVDALATATVSNVANITDVYYPVFLTNGKLVVADQESGAIIEMNADGTQQAAIGQLPAAPNGTWGFTGLVYDSSFNELIATVMQTGVGEQSEYLAFFTPAGVSQGTLLLSTNDSPSGSNIPVPQGLAVGPTGSVFVYGPTGLTQVALTAATESSPWSVASTDSLIGTPVTGVAMDPSSGDVFVCTSSALTQYSSTWETITTFGANAGCTGVTVDGTSLVVIMPGGFLLNDTVQLVTIATGTETQVASDGYANSFPFHSGPFQVALAEPSNAQHGTASDFIVSSDQWYDIGGPTVSYELATLEVVNSAAVRDTIAVQSYPSARRFVSVASSPTSPDTLVVDQWGGSVLSFANAGATQSQLLGEVSPDPRGAAIDPAHSYLFDVTSAGTVYRFGLAGGVFGATTSLKFPTPLVSTAPHQSSPLQPTTITVDRGKIFEGFLYEIVSVTETGTDAHVAAKLATSEHITYLTALSNGTMLAAVTGSKPEILKLSATGAVTKTIKTLTLSGLTGVAESAAGQILATTATGLYLVSSTGHATSLLAGSFVGVSVSSTGAVIVATPSAVEATTLARLGVS